MTDARELVKALEWLGEDGKSFRQANTMLGQYQISWLLEFECWQLCRPHQQGKSWRENFSRHASRNEAFAAAQADFTARILSALDLTAVEALQAEVARCHRRLEIDRVYTTSADMEEFVEHVVPMDERATMPDGITCRDATIELQDERICEMEAEVARLKDAVRAEFDAAAIYENTPTDRGGKSGPKARAYAKWLDARAALLVMIAQETPNGQ